MRDKLPRMTFSVDPDTREIIETHAQAIRMPVSGMMTLVLREVAPKIPSIIKTVMERAAASAADALDASRSGKGH